MGIHVAIEHRTLYTFDRMVAIAPHVVRLRPAPHCRTPVLAYSLTVEPAGHFVNWQQDPFGNHQARLVFPEKATSLSLAVDLVADLAVINPFDFFVEPSAERYPFTYERSLARDLAPYLAVEPAGPLLAEWLRPEKVRSRSGDPRIVDFLVRLNRRLRDDVAYTTRMEPGVQSAEETLEKRLGSCRDSGWLLVQILRHLGLAARFVSGYLVQLAADSEPLEGPAGPSEDFTDLHAWAEVYVPGAGWIGLDPTSGLLAGEGHIPLACTPEPSSAAPVTGVVGPCEATLDFSNVVTRLREAPRASRPYTEDQWAAVLALGHAVDRDLARADVRLTMGGEPTFVAAVDPSAPDRPEWTTAADGPDKRRRAAALAANLAERFAPDGLIQHGQGKWYPGEALPRWQIGVLWRADGDPLWTRRRLLADPWTAGSAGAAEAAVVAHALTTALGLPAERCLPAYEDALLRLWREATLPEGGPAEPGEDHDADPSDPALARRDERERLRRRLDAHTGDPAGHVLPLHRPAGDGAWATSEWKLRRGRLVLAEGDSPLGLRLPLDSLSWHPPPLDPERSRFEARGPLPPAARPARPGPRAAGTVVRVGDAPPTALCVEVRNGHVHVFLPPLTDLEHALELIATVEQVAAELDQPLVIEGYPPPEDPRLRRLTVTPDPGVIEVNVQPAASWPELVDIAEGLDEDARAARLTTERFDLDGTATGTGGGSHLTLGGPTPSDSPLLRRPDLLRSLITFWQHHPSLSYLFSGRFVGPTSQAPRVDEGRPEILHELEIAFAEMDRLAPDPPYWMVDRLLRHLLIDVTGNTHRAEFCVDKLYSPDSERGRAGLVEMRGFEMPPHPRLALTQALLVRALVSRFWDEPYTGRLVRWGTELHDRFLLPWYVEADAADVVDDLRRHGRAFETAWLAPFLELRFPRLGRVDVAGAGVELRGAIEPWHVLGEEAAAGGTARYVDSSVERVQVRVDGMVEGRHVLTCNGRVVPLTPTGTPGTWVAGVRYRAWAPPSALHPTIGVHAPLVFDLVDRWNERSLGGCSYHVAHPGGLAYGVAPINANEAEARRRSRFSALGHTAGRLDPSRLPDDRLRAPDQPRTLDLRRPVTGGG
jgi:uncharacterized protein (DUF2126 family)/transglutaminase-like putative cysteine protease